MPRDIDLFLLLKCDHPELNAAEAEAILKAEHIIYKPLASPPRLLRLRGSPETSEAISARAYGTRLCAEELLVTVAEKAVEGLKGLDFKELLRGASSFRISLRRTLGKAPREDMGQLREEMISHIHCVSGARMSLGRPREWFIGVFSGDRFHFGRILSIIERSLEGRRPKSRPFFHPSTLYPKLAGTMVNLSRARVPGTFLDPFCGAGATLIEAGLLGCRPVGLDISGRMVEGARRNLRYFGVADHDLVLGDARSLPFSSFTSIATDPPYGRVASTEGAEMEELYRGFLNQAAGLMAGGSFLCLAAPRRLGVGGLGEEAGFKLTGSYLLPIHGSLTREVAVFRR